jgi:hypothetical protein
MPVGAALLARLLHLGQIVKVTIPSVEQEVARELVRARDDCRADLVRARHWESKLASRQAIVYYGGPVITTWNTTTATTAATPSSATCPLRCLLSPRMNDSHPLWTSSRVRGSTKSRWIQ